MIPARVCEPGTGSFASHVVARACDCGHHSQTMNWTTPVYEELKMDAEIGSYQEDGEWPPIVERVEPAVDASDAE